MWTKQCGQDLDSDGRLWARILLIIGGGKGLKYFLEHLGPAAESYFEDLGSWTRIPEHINQN